MKISTLTLAFVFASCTFLLAQDDVYKYRVDLIEVIADQLKVELKVPSSVPSDEVIFHFPRIIPGTYEIHDYGQFVNNLKAFDNKNNELAVERVDKNTWKIPKAKKLDRISYLVEDVWDAKLREPLFEPSGTNFEAGKCFVLNGNGVFGFFKGKEMLPFEVAYDRPNDFYASTSLRRVGGDFDTDIFKAANYHDLIDAPIMYNEPDTVNFKLGYGDIQISVYSPNKKVSAKELSEKIRPMLEAQNKYLGNILPVDRYHFILYLSPVGFPSGSIGALEHARSSMFCLTEEKAEKLSTIVVDIAAHEFFHIVTPLYIQSEEIFNFDYLEPKMSKHLWLYEGVVEYMAHHMQCRYKLGTQEDFLKKLGDKVRTSRRYKTAISLSEMSKNCLVEPYANQYNNIYQKGALAAMCLDLKLMQLSKGKYDLQFLLRDLSGYYGQDTPFKDEELYEKIIEITRFRELKDFFMKHIEGIEPLNYNEFINPFGVEYFEEATVMEISPLGGIENRALKTDTLDRFYIALPEKLDEFGSKYIGFKEGDVILEWDNRPLSPKTTSNLFIYMQNVKEGDLLEVKILRKNAKDVYEEKTLKATMTKISVEKKDVFQFIEKPTDEQLKMRKIWMEAKNQN